MSDYEKAMTVMRELFSKDCQFALATAENNRPSVRVVDTYFDQGSFYVVTYMTSQKVKELGNNRYVSLCKQCYRFNGTARVIGHPLEPHNKEIREKLTEAFAPWYFEHNNENDSGMCYIKIEPSDGFFYKDGSGYKVNFLTKEAEEFPFTFNILVV